MGQEVIDWIDQAIAGMNRDVLVFTLGAISCCIALYLVYVRPDKERNEYTSLTLLIFIALWLIFT